MPSAERIITAYNRSGGAGAYRRFDSAASKVHVVSTAHKLRKRLFELVVTQRDANGSSVRPDVTLIGKVYPDRARGAAAFAALAYLWSHGMSERFSVAQPIAWFDAQSFLLMAKADGTSLHDLLIAASCGVEAARAAAGWLRTIHALPPPDFLPIRDVRPVVNLRRIVAELGAASPQERRRIEELARCLARPSPRAGDPTFLHGDFHPRNIFFRAGRVTVIDLDHSIVGDRAWDLGYLAGQIDVMAIQRPTECPRLNDVATTAIDAYVAGLTDPEGEEVRRQLPRYRALTLLESAHYSACILHSRDGSIVPRYLAAAERVL